MAYQNKKTFLLFRATFEQLSLQKANFDGFLSNFCSNFSRNYGKRFGKSRATCGKPSLRSMAVLVGRAK